MGCGKSKFGVLPDAVPHPVPVLDEQHSSSPQRRRIMSRQQQPPPSLAPHQRAYPSPPPPKQQGAATGSQPQRRVSPSRREPPVPLSQQGQRVGNHSGQEPPARHGARAESSSHSSFTSGQSRQSNSSPNSSTPNLAEAILDASNWVHDMTRRRDDFSTSSYLPDPSAPPDVAGPSTPQRDSRRRPGL